MKHFLFFLLLIGLLTACSTKETVETKPDPEPEQNETVDEPVDDNEDDDSEGKNHEEDPSEKDPEEDPVVDVKPLYFVNPNTWTIEPITDTNVKVVLLTIDDAPDKHAVEMAQLLKQLGVPAIFFVNGHFLDTPEEREKLKAIHELGFSIGNHTYNHPNLRDLSEEEQRDEIIKLNDLVEEIIGEKPRFFRAPFGANTDFSHQLAKEENMIVMNWTYGYDFMAGYMEKEALADIMVNTPLLNNGGNLLMHDRTWTFEALEDIVAGLRNKGYQFADPALITGAENLQ